MNANGAWLWLGRAAQGVALAFAALFTLAGIVGITTTETATAILLAALVVLAWGVVVEFLLVRPLKRRGAA